MNYYAVGLWSTFSILIPVAAAVYRYKTVLKDYRPFLWLLCLGVFNEMISLICVYTIRSNTVNSNIYVFVEYCLVLWLYYRWSESRRGRFVVLAVTGFLLWLTDNVILHSITENNSLFREFYSFVIVFLSIEVIFRVLVYETSLVYKNAMFLIAVAFVFYFGLKAYVESFNVLHIGLSSDTLNSLWKLLYLVNIVANLLFTTAVLCMPKKQKFIILY